jgi:hypothetical protein
MAKPWWGCGPEYAEVCRLWDAESRGAETRDPGPESRDEETRDAENPASLNRTSAVPGSAM